MTINCSPLAVCTVCFERPVEVLPLRSPYSHLCAQCRAEVYRQHLTRNGELPTDGCKVPGCIKPHRALGYCERHYRKFKYTGGDPIGVGQGRGPRPNRRKTS